MTSTIADPRAVSFEDFCVLIKDGQKADLLDGVIYMASPDNLYASRINGWLYWIMLGFIDDRQLGEIFFSRVAYQLDEINAPEPDIGVVLHKNCHKLRRGRVDGAPDLAVEIVSPDSIERDYKVKRKKYEQAGVSEYWIIDEVTHLVTLLHLGPKRFYREAKSRRGLFHSKVLPGFWLNPDWLWQSPLPSPMKVLQEILRSSDTSESRA